MRLKRSDAAVAAVGVLFSLTFMLSNVSELGYALLSADVLWMLTRVEIQERHDRPGYYTTLRGRIGVARLLLLGVIYGASVYALFVIKNDIGPKARATVLADFGIAGLCFMLLGEFKRSGDDAANWLVGGRAERRIGEKLDSFKDRGWLVLHGYKREWGGDVDHILCGPRGAFIVETKSYRFRRRDLRQAAYNAWWLREKLGVRWVTGVLCVDEQGPPRREGRIWVVGHEQLIRWLETQNDAPIDPVYARNRLLAADASG